jgi:thiosulfate/3-mercaptopyruvate sulfurtransferase
LDFKSLNAKCALYIATPHSMKQLISLLIGFTLSAAAMAQPLLSPSELQSKLTDPKLLVIDIRDPKSYAAQHIPGAVNAPYGAWRGAASNPGELPALPKLTKLVQSLGLTPDQHVVVVSSGSDATDFGASARVYWTLKVLGLKDLSVLNGGVKAWSLAGLPQNNLPAKVIESAFAPQLDKRMIATREDLIERVKSGASTLIDARPAEFFQGETRHAAAKLPGTLQGAVNLEHDKWFTPGTSTFVSVEKARQIAVTSRLNPEKETISFCNTGHWAATNWFAMSEVLGQKNVMLYAGSMVDWSQDANGLPMANVPSRAKQLLIDTKLWAARTFN